MISNCAKFLLAVGFLLTSISPALAHVVVKPSEAGVASFQIFNIGVPNEKDMAVTGLRIVMPVGLQHVAPSVKPGWQIEIKRDGSGDDAKVTEIKWTNGSIPAGQRDDFGFSAQVPAGETTLSWKAYQTYSDGTVVSWDQAPMANETDAQKEEREKTGKGPFSQTKIVNDLTANMAEGGRASSDQRLPLYFSLVAVALAAVALVRKAR